MSFGESTLESTSVSHSRRLAPLFVVIGVVCLWELLHLCIPKALTSPAATVLALGELMRTADFWDSAWASGQALLLASAISIVGGTVLGVWFGVRRFAGEVAEPILLNIFALPKVTLYPLVLLVFGLGISAKVAFGVMHGVIPIMTFTMHAIREMHPVYLRTARVMRLPVRQTMRHVVMPAILPQWIAGLRLGFSLTLLGVLIGEMFASRRGLGYLLTNAMNLGDIRDIMAIALFLTVVALTVNGLLMRWSTRSRPAS